MGVDDKRCKEMLKILDEIRGKSPSPEAIRIGNQMLTSDSCTTCIWLNRQPTGNKMLCIMPGACEWSYDGKVRSAK